MCRHWKIRVPLIFLPYIIPGWNDYGLTVRAAQDAPPTENQDSFLIFLPYIIPGWNDIGLTDMVGVRGFEPPTPSSRRKCATRLRYTPKLKN